MRCRPLALLTLLVLTLLVLALPTAAQTPQGLPLMQHFTPRDHHASATNVAVLTTPDGYTFVGNSRGLLRFDGSHWDLLELPGRQSARAVALGNDGQVYVGSYDRFGRADVDASGALQFVDLTHQLRSENSAPQIGQVWTICSTQDGMFVYSDTTLVQLGADGQRQYWPMSLENRAPYCTRAGVFARVQGRGLSRLEADGYRLFPGGEVFAEGPLYQVFDTPDGPLVVGEHGFYRLTDDGLRLLTDTDGDRLADHPPYAGVRLRNGGYAFGTYAGELLHFSADLRLLTVQVVSRNTIFELGVDHEGGLWAATEGDLLRLHFPSAWSVLSSDVGLVGQTYDTAYFRGELYIATSLGVVRVRSAQGRDQLVPAVTTSLEAVALEPDAAGLLIADRIGVLALEDTRAEPRRLLESEAPSALLRSKVHPERVWVPATSGLDIIESVQGRWQPRPRIDLGELALAGIEEADDGSLWLGNSRGGPLQLRFDAAAQLVERREYGAADGLNLDPDYGSYVVMLDGAIHVISNRLVQVFKEGRFAPIDAAPFSQFEHPYDMSISETGAGAFAYSASKLLFRPHLGAPWQPLLGGTALAGGYYNVHLDDDGLIRLSAWEGVLQYDPRVPEPVLPALAVRMRSISLRDDDGSVVRQPLNPDGGQPQFPSGALLQFDFTLPTNEPGTQFRLRIRGMFDDFTAWAPVATPALTLRVPGPGDYVLEVQGRTPSGRLAESLQFAFQVAPKWWQQTSARAIGVLLLLAALAGFANVAIRWRYRRYRAINRTLEARITERTAELEEANRRLAELATEDGLTGIANRRALEQALKREGDRCGELHQTLAVVMIDVDHFKQFNDRYGHLAGDQRLLQVVDVLSRHVQPVRELLARFGGEEFVLVLPGISRADAVERAEALRRDVEQSITGTTVSAGVAAEIPRPDGASAKAILERADSALYRAKNNGRNRVESDA